MSSIRYISTFITHKQRFIIYSNLLSDKPLVWIFCKKNIWYFYVALTTLLYCVIQPFISNLCKISCDKRYPSTSRKSILLLFRHHFLPAFYLLCSQTHFDICIIPNINTRDVLSEETPIKRFYNQRNELKSSY